MQTTLRPTIHHNLAGTIKHLIQLTVRGEEMMKSGDAGKFEKIACLTKEKEPLCKEILFHYKNIRREWIRGTLNKELYVTNLKPLAQYMADNKNLSMPVEIEIEIKKLFPKPEPFRSRVDCAFIN